MSTGLRERVEAVDYWLVHPDRSYTPHGLAMEAHRRLEAALASAESGDEGLHGDWCYHEPPPEGEPWVHGPECMREVYVEPRREDRWRLAASPSVDGLDAAWAAVEAALPKGWAIAAGFNEPTGWRYVAQAQVGHGYGSTHGVGPTPTAALRALAAALPLLPHAQRLRALAAEVER